MAIKISLYARDYEDCLAVLTGDDYPLHLKHYFLAISKKAMMGLEYITDTDVSNESLHKVLLDAPAGFGEVCAIYRNDRSVENMVAIVADTSAVDLYKELSRFYHSDVFIMESFSGTNIEVLIDEAQG